MSQPIPTNTTDLFGDLDPGMPIYRILDFFGFARMVESHTLYVPQATGFSDENEGIDGILGGLVIKAGLFRDGIGLPWKSNEEAIYYHSELKMKNYVSCWTQQAESVAMWSLYSTDRCSVSVQTTVGKLRRALDEHWNREGKQKILNAQLDEEINGISKVTLKQVNYHSLAKLRSRISRFGRALNQLDVRLARRGEFLIDRWSKALKDNKQGQSFSLLSKLTLEPFFTKDESYAHEREVRATLEIGQAHLSEADLRSTKELLDQDPSIHHLLAAFFSRPPANICPREIGVTVPHNFIDFVRIDPRSPPHKKEFIEQFAHRNGIITSEATAFGYLPRRLLLDFHVGEEIRSRES